MTGKVSDLAGLDRLTLALVEDILSTPDNEIMAEARQDHGRPAEIAAAIRGQFEKAVALVAKRRLIAAKLAVAKDHRRPSGVTPPDPAEARHRLDRILAQDAALTLAARSGQGFSDADVEGMLEDFQELGLASDQDEL